MDSNNKTKALENVLLAIEKEFGKGSIMSAKSERLQDVEFLSTGCISLDKILGGGIARGRIIEIMGMESTGKSTLTLHMISEAQKQGHVCALLDVEHALDGAYARSLGVDMDNLLISQPGSAEEALDIVKMLSESGSVGLIVVDSVAALVPKVELEGNIGDSNMGVQARLMSKAMRILAGITSKSNTTIIFINQIRMKIGVFYGCFQGETPITMADGSQKTIKELVDTKNPGPVLSYDPNFRTYKSKKIINWFKNGKVELGDWLTIDLTHISTRVAS